MATFIQHVSITANDPERAARILAAMTAGEPRPFRARGLSEGAWVCLWDAARNRLIEFIPCGTTIIPGSDSASFTKTDLPVSYYNACHVQLSVDVSLAHIQYIASQHGCRHYFRPASGGPLYEVWLEEQILIEFVSDEITQHIEKQNCSV